jgi:hypothetical protein
MKGVLCAQVSKALNRWSENVYHTRRVRAVSARALRRMRSIAAARAFCNWRDKVTHVRKSLFVMVQVDKRLHRKILKRLLHVWRLATSESLYWTFHDLRVTPRPPTLRPPPARAMWARSRAENVSAALHPVSRSSCDFCKSHMSST